MDEGAKWVELIPLSNAVRLEMYILLKLSYRNTGEREFFLIVSEYFS